MENSNNLTDLFERRRKVEKPEQGLAEAIAPGISEATRKIEKGNKEGKNKEGETEGLEVKVEDTAANQAPSNSFMHQFVGKPVVRIIKVLDGGNCYVKDGKTVKTALISLNGDSVFAAIDPDYVDAGKLREGDTVVYDEPFVVHVVDSALPIEKPYISFDDIGGLEEQKKEVQKILGRFDPNNRKLEKKLGIKPVKGILLYGPPGTGKSMMAKAIANYLSVPFFWINTPELFCSKLGETAANIKSQFDIARKNAPSVLYFDEITRIAGKRRYDAIDAEREVAGATEEFQAQMDGLHNNHDNGFDGNYILVVASTNLPEITDPAVLRRFDRHLCIPAPARNEKKDILCKKIRKVETKIDLEGVVSLIESANSHATGNDIEIITEYAKENAALNDRSYIQNDDFAIAVDKYSRRIDLNLGILKELGRR